MASDVPDRTEETARPAAARELRVDPPHPAQSPGGESRKRPAPAYAAAHAVAGGAGQQVEAGDDGSFDDLFADDSAGSSVENSPMMLARHAASLADRLQQRLADVDRRESRLNSQEAEFDSRVRNARLWIDQRDAELNELQQRLEQWEQELSSRQDAAAAQLSEADELTQRLAELAEREKASEAIRLELELGRTEQQTKIDALEFETAACRSRQLELDEAKRRIEQRHRDLDGREATLYTEQERISRERIALDGREAQVRTSESEGAAREARLKEFEARLAEEAGELEFQRAELQRASAECAERLEALSSDERRLEFRQREIATAIERFERMGIVEQTMDKLRQEAEGLAMRSAYVDQAELLLAERQAEAEERRRTLEQAQLAHENRITRERRELVAQEQQLKIAADQRNRELTRREAGLDQRQRALEEIAEQLQATQREALEMRLATEETWLQLQGALAPATLSRSIAQVRARLTDHFHLAAEEVRRRRQEMESVRVQLAEQYEGLQQQRQELQRWAELREREFGERAERMAMRERELESQHEELQALHRVWDAERAELRSQIQQLLAGARQSVKLAA